MATQRLKDLAALATLRDRLAQAERKRAEEARAARQRAAREQAAQREFGDAMDELGVKPLAPHGRRHNEPHPHPPRAASRARDDAAVLAESVSDEIDVDSLLDTDDSLSFVRAGIGPDVLRKLRRGSWVIQAEIDLHGLRVDEARSALGEFLRDAVKRGRRCVRIVHGKGLGSKDKVPVLKGKVRAWLVQRAEVIAFCQARAAEGGSGALIVLLAPGAARG
jgi:DNA-nicking Smr family endonuclease